MHAVDLVQISETVAELQWSSNTSNDMIADSSLAILLGIDASPATVKRVWSRLLWCIADVRSHLRPTYPFASLPLPLSLSRATKIEWIFQWTCPKFRI